jgi:esterase FrsA
MFIINGPDDAFVPQTDTLIFEGCPNTEVHLLPGTGHCCVSKINEMMQMINDWLKT